MKLRICNTSILIHEKNKSEVDIGPHLNTVTTVEIIIMMIIIIIIHSYLFVC
jgi:hypothetical protein